jgi:endonuclease G
LDDVVEVYITAAMIDPNGSDRAGEWISVANYSNAILDLSDWQLSTLKSQRVALKNITASSLQLNPGESVSLMTGNAFSMPNEAGVINLWNEKGERIDRVNYIKGMVKTGKVLLFMSPKDIVRHA